MYLQVSRIAAFRLENRLAAQMFGRRNVPRPPSTGALRGNIRKLGYCGNYLTGRERRLTAGKEDFELVG